MLHLLIPAVSGLIGKAIDRAVPDANQAAELKGRVIAEAQAMATAELQGAVSIIKTEAGSEHWLAATWRPITMLTFVVIVANNYIIAPYFNAMFGWSVSLEIPPDMWDLLKIGLGGYVAGRSVEKAAKAWKEK